MKKARCENCCAYLKPKLVSLVLTIIVLALPLVPEGGFRYSPLIMLMAYLNFGLFYPFILLLFLAFIVYLVISLLVLFVAKVSGCPKKAK